MAGLKKTTVGEGDATGRECSVCLEGYKAGDTLRTMPCSHDFHGHCILCWLAVSRVCPLCRFALPPAARWNRTRRTTLVTTTMTQKKTTKLNN
ncbi:hypothetical protein BAE44_0013939 [Dichanthelium oligosanthes]|uniref:RING-type domain-containing protein n=1 Tax=Dichanthelium oligosanthes TaxID=888268 RepID=A0A1E5VIX8_9POAL|nr:hypothetical protein BAE44_0013939 [Dichanthelium oligosanthes]